MPCISAFWRGHDNRHGGHIVWNGPTLQTLHVKQAFNGTLASPGKRRHEVKNTCLPMVAGGHAAVILLDPGPHLLRFLLTSAPRCATFTPFSYDLTSTHAASIGPPIF
eukprot:scaffold44364_cov20-Tisochrysis_lutea.AAC.3